MLTSTITNNFNFFSKILGYQQATNNCLQDGINYKAVSNFLLQNRLSFPNCSFEAKPKNLKKWHCSTNYDAPAQQVMQLLVFKNITDESDYLFLAIAKTFLLSPKRKTKHVDWNQLWRYRQENWVLLQELNLHLTFIDAGVAWLHSSSIHRAVGIIRLLSTYQMGWSKYIEERLLKTSK